jgi:hypothetical protein
VTVTHYRNKGVDSMRSLTPWYEYPINRFDMAVRNLTDCECESMPCRHVGEYNEARENLCDLIKKTSTGDVIYRSVPHV